MIQDKNLKGVLDIVENIEESRREKAAWDAKEWGLFYHLSPARRNLIDWIPMQMGESVLEVGAECGAMTGHFLRHEMKVTALEKEPEKAEILKKRYEGKEPEVSVISDFSELPENQTYDLVVALGSLPLAKQYFSEEEDAYAAFLARLKDLVAMGGRFILALPNKLGLKYFAGAREDITGAPFTGVEDYFFHPEVRTFARRELADMLETAGFKDLMWYYPYPDWRFPFCMYSDERLPKPGELNRNLESADQERYVFFDETKAFDTVTKEGLFPEFSNSFLVIAGGEKQTLPSYVKYSAERDPKYALRTEQRRDGVIRKAALYPEGVPHVRSIFNSFQLLSETLKDTQIKVAPCRLLDDIIEEKYVKGESLQHIIQDLALHGKEEEIGILIMEYMMRLEPFDKLHDIDLIFSNLIVPETAKTVDEIKHADWVLIDYEWTFEEPKPRRYVIYRSFLMASAEITNSETCKLPKLLKRINATEERVKKYEERERAFQKEVLGSSVPVRDLVKNIKPGVIPFIELDKAYRKKDQEPAPKKRRFFR